MSKIENQDAYDEIVNYVVDDRTQREVKKLIDSVPYTSVVLCAIAAWLSDIGDDEGANILTEFTMKTYAVHEANTV